MDASDTLGLSRFDAIGRLGNGRPEICGGAVVMLVHDCGSGISIVQAIVRDISDISDISGIFCMLCIFCIFDIFDAFSGSSISGAWRVSDSIVLSPSTSINGAAAGGADGGEIRVGAGAEGGFEGIDCGGGCGWDSWLLEGNGCCSFALFPPASPVESITGNF